MGDLSPRVYRKKVVKKLSESDKPTKEKIEEKAPLGVPKGTPLDDLRDKLFNDGDTYNPDDGIDPAFPDGQDIEGVDDQIALLGGDELGGDSVDDGHMGKSGRNGYIDPNYALEDEQPEGVISNKEEDLQDMATDLVAEVLIQLKDLRDRYKQESPEKAQLVRKLYDYILKGKDKIASELIKAEQEIGMGVPPEQ